MSREAPLPLRLWEELGRVGKDVGRTTCEAGRSWALLRGAVSDPDPGSVPVVGLFTPGVPATRSRRFCVCSPRPLIPVIPRAGVQLFTGRSDDPFYFCTISNNVPTSRLISGIGLSLPVLSRLPTGLSTWMIFSKKQLLVSGFPPFSVLLPACLPSARFGCCPFFSSWGLR